MEKEVIIEMAALLIKVIANVRDKKILWEDLSPDLQRDVITKLHNDSMSVAGYEMLPRSGNFVGSKNK